MGEGRGEGRGGHRLEGFPRRPRARAGLSTTPSLPATAGRGVRGLCPAPPGTRGRSQPGFFAVSCQATRSPWLSVPLTPFPSLWRKPPAQEPQQLCCPQQTQKRRSQTVSQKPPAQTASGLWAPGGGERRSPTLPWRCAPDGGRGCPTTMTALRFGLASFLSPRMDQRSVFRLKGKEKRENSAIKIVFMVSQTLSHAFSHVIFTVIF